MSSSRLLVSSLCASFGKTQCGAKARTLFAHFFLSMCAASLRVPPVWMRSSMRSMSLSFGSHSLMVIMRLTPSRTFAQMIRVFSGKASLNRFAAPSSGKAITFSGATSRSERVVWSSALTRNESNRNRSTRACISNV